MTGLLGLEQQFSVFRGAIASGRLPHAWLLHGPRGVGKGGFAGRVAARLLAEGSADPPAGEGFELDVNHPTARLIGAGSHPDLILLERLENDRGTLARNVTIDQVRRLKSVFANTPSQGERRCVVIDAIDDLERGAANALLKALEEPPAATVFLLVSHSPGRLLPTIRSRCRSLMFGRLSDEIVARIVQTAVPEIDAATLAAVVAAADGSAGAAMGFAEADLASLETALHELANRGDADNRVRLDLASKLAGKAAAKRYEAFLARVPAFIAQQARGRSGAGLARAIAAWEATQALAATAIGQSLPAENVVFELAGRVAELAPGGADAKA